MASAAEQGHSLRIVLACISEDWVNVFVLVESGAACHASEPTTLANGALYLRRDVSGQAEPIHDCDSNLAVTAFALN
jgi:hypothetical protein